MLGIGPLAPSLRGRSEMVGTLFGLLFGPSALAVEPDNGRHGVLPLGAGAGGTVAPSMRVRRPEVLAEHMAPRAPALEGVQRLCLVGACRREPIRPLVPARLGTGQPSDP